MKSLVISLNTTVAHKDSKVIIITTSLLFIILLLWVQGGKIAVSGAFILALLGSLLGGFNVALAYTYVRAQGKFILRNNLHSGLTLVRAFLSMGSAVCGVAFISLLLGFFGFSAMLSLLSYQGQEVGYIGLIFLSIASYTLAQKVAAPNVC